MASGAVPDGLFWSVYEGSISGYDNCIERRPYHRNCGCALHNKSFKNCTHKLPMCNSVSYPIRRAWSEGSLVLAASIHSPSSPSQVATGGKPQPKLVNLEDEQNKNYFADLLKDMGDVRDKTKGKRGTVLQVNCRMNDQSEYKKNQKAAGLRIWSLFRLYGICSTY
ncbi:hypothetical protein VNO77_24171 [Canavalia gladiata]|uniref:Uncharacterized protein n=1 Tax=Canavalia gladiata TaxID=3824 RepID=A0AAN9QCD1_CANGL